MDLMLLRKPMNSDFPATPSLHSCDLAPGVGLLLLRVVAAVAVVFHPGTTLPSSLQLGPTILYLFTGLVGTLLLVGLWTSVAGTILATLAFSSAFLYAADPWACVFIGTLGAALALLGPGNWSVDAQLFPWNIIQFPASKS
jgi:hypothetical protein